MNLRASVRRRYAEVVDFKEYEAKIQKLIDTHVSTGSVEQVTTLVNIFDKDAFLKELEKIEGTASKADTIAHRTKRTIEERMDEDPAFYRKFSEMLEDAIRAFREKRLANRDYLSQVTKIAEAIRTRRDDNLPEVIRQRGVAKLAITVHPDMRLQIVAPLGSNCEQVFSRVERRAGWILRQWRYFEKFQPTHPGPRYVSGATHLYLGRQYRLKLHAGAPRMVKLVGRFLHVWAGDRDKSGLIKMLLDRWYCEHAKRVFEHRLQLCLDQCPSLRLTHKPRLIIRKMTHRWGSCTKAGNVLLNRDLVKVPIHCVDYVIVHELCHLHVHNHSPAFARLLSRCMPDWKRRKDRLESFVT